MGGKLGRRRLVLALATWGGVGLLPGAPGTWGTLAALPLWWILAHLDPWGYGLATAAVLLLALWASGPAQAYLGRRRPPRHCYRRSGGPVNHPGRRPPDLAGCGRGLYSVQDFGYPETAAHPLVHQRRLGRPGSGGGRRGGGSLARLLLEIYLICFP